MTSGSSIPFHRFTAKDKPSFLTFVTVNVTVTVGQGVNARSTRLALKAMTMETHVATHRDAEVEALYVVAAYRV